MEPQKKLAYCDHALVLLSLRNLVRFLPINLEGYSNICAGRVALAIASAVWADRKKPERQHREGNDDKYCYHGIFSCFA